MRKNLTYILITESNKVNIKTTNPHCSVWPTVIDVKNLRHVQCLIIFVTRKT